MYVCVYVSFVFWAARPIKCKKANGTNLLEPNFEKTGFKVQAMAADHSDNQLPQKM